MDTTQQVALLKLSELQWLVYENVFSLISPCNELPVNKEAVHQLIFSL